MRALVLSGGGSRGAYEVGAIEALAEKGVKWDVITGVSVGALNGSWMAQHQNPNDGVDQLRQFWYDIQGNKSIYKNWWCGPLGSLFYGGAFNTKPLRDLVLKNLDMGKLDTSGIKLKVGAVSLNTGEYRSVDQNTPNFDQWIMASSAFPVAFPPETIDGGNWIDGGVRNIIPLNDALQTPGVDVVDIVLATNPNYVAPFDAKQAKNALLVGSRCIDLMSDEIIDGDMVQSVRINLYMPDVSMRLQHPLTFDPTEIRKVIDVAYQRTLSDFKG